MADHELSTHFLPSSVYDLLKPITTTVLPAVSACYLALAQVWGLPNPDKVVATVAAVNTLLGVVLALATASYNAATSTAVTPVVGQLNVVEDEDGAQSFKLVVDAPLEDLATSEAVTFKVVKD